MRIGIVAGTVVGLLALGAPPAGAGGGGHCADLLAEGSGTAVDMVDACFTPSVLHVAPGETVTFTNRDPMPHNVAPAGWGWGHVDDLRQGESFTATFDERGVFSYACSLHPGMTGAVIVEPASAVALTSEVVPPDGDDPGAALAIVAAGLLGLAVGSVIGRARGKRSTVTTGPVG